MKGLVKKLALASLLTLLCLSSTAVYAQICSPHIGKASINEIFKDNSNQSNSTGDFLEIKILDPLITEDDFKDWSVGVCEKDGPGNRNDGNGCASVENGNPISLSTFTDKIPEWLVIDSSNDSSGIGNFINFTTGFDVILRDETGKVVDYLSVGHSELEDSNCPGTALPFESDAGAPGGSDKFIFRQSDGIGSWNFETSAIEEGTRNASNDGDEPTFGYYIISFSGSGITCEPFTITVSAVDSDGDPLSIGAGTVLTISTDIANDGWTNPAGSGGSYIVVSDTATVQFQLRKLSPATLEIDVSDNNGNTDDDGDRDDDFVTFSNAGFRFYADNVVDDIGVQYSGKSSFVTPGEQTLTIKAVQSSASDPGVCEALIINSSVDIGIAYQCDAPATCATPTDALTINSKTVDDSNSAFTPVSLDFNASGVAEFTLKYIDAGLISLLVSADLAVNNTTDPLGTENVTGSSNSILVRPAGLCVQAKETAVTYNACEPDPATDFDTCDLYRTVGEDFELEVSGRAWVSSGEANSDFCDNNITKNFVLGNIALSNNVVAPAGGENAVLSVNTTSISGSDGYIDQGVNIDEVGVFTFTATPGDTYHLQTISSSTSVDVGRFKPHHFLIDNASITPANGTFTYLGQAFIAQYDISAVDALGNVTTNYRNAGSGENFVKLSIDDDISYGAVDNSSGINYLTSRLSKGTSSFSWGDGIAMMVQAPLTLARDSGLDGPYTDVYIGALMSDSDDVTLLNSDLDLDTEDPPAGVDKEQLGVLASEFRYGRVYIPPVYGPEITVLEQTDVPFIMQYWDSTASIFKTNTDDSSTVFHGWTWNGGSNCHDPETVEDALVCADTVVNIPAPTSIVSNGSGVLTINRPGSGSSGVLNMEVIVDSWLQYNWEIDWDEDLSTVDDINPSFQANFGVFRGHDRIIYWRENHNP